MSDTEGKSAVHTDAFVCSDCGAPVTSAGNFEGEYSLGFLRTSVGCFVGTTSGLVVLSFAIFFHMNGCSTKEQPQIYHLGVMAGDDRHTPYWYFDADGRPNPEPPPWQVRAQKRNERSRNIALTRVRGIAHRTDRGNAQFVDEEVGRQMEAYDEIFTKMKYGDDQFPHTVILWRIQKKLGEESPFDFVAQLAAIHEQIAAYSELNSLFGERTQLELEFSSFAYASHAHSLDYVKQLHSINERMKHDAEVERLKREAAEKKQADSERTATEAEIP